MNLIEIAKKVISIESTFSTGTSDLCKFLVEFASSENKDLNYKILPSEYLGEDHCNLLIGPQLPKNEPGLLLLSHLDSSDPGSYGLWTKTNGNPFEAHIYGDILYGAGATNKLDFLCKLIALLSFDIKKFKKNIYLFGTNSENNRLQGLSYFLSKDQIKVKSAMAAYPTDLSILYQGLGLATVDFFIPFSEEEKEFHKWHDISPNSFSHSKVFRTNIAKSTGEVMDEIGAIEKALRFLAKLPSVAIMEIDGGSADNIVSEHATLEFVPTGKIEENINAKLSFVLDQIDRLRTKLEEYPLNEVASDFSAINIGKIRTDQEGIKLTVSCSILPSIPEREYRTWILNLKKTCLEQAVEFSFKNYQPSFKLNRSSEWLTELFGSLKKVGLDEKLSGLPLTSTEANLLNKMGIDCVLFGAGKSQGFSSFANEHIKISDLETSIDFYKEVIAKEAL